MTKICTSIEQSKKLLELGLDADTADMGYNGIENRDTGRIWYDKYPTTMPNVDSIPAWSLVALLDILRKTMTDFKLEYTQSCDAFELVTNNISAYQLSSDPLDATYIYVKYLLEIGYIKTEKK